jgi:lipoate-protein ligase A
MLNNRWDLTVSGAHTGAENMALDEAAFQLLIDGKLNAPLLRFYTWSEPCITIGYFQKYNDFATGSVPVFRRLTGGLAVNHSSDISYSLVVSEKHLPCVRDQQRTYMTIHSGLRAGLQKAGIVADHCASDGSLKTSLCIASVFAHDLSIDGKKVLGSCQRRRGGVLLQQGSIHVAIPEGTAIDHFAQALAGGVAETLQIFLAGSSISQDQRSLASSLSANKYSSMLWNSKF